MLLVILLFSLLASCTSIPDSYAPPIQRRPLSGAEPRALGHFVAMSDPNAEAYLVSDFGALESGSWRWARKRPEMRFHLESVDNLRFQMNFAIAGQTFRDTGPVALSIFINGQPFDRVKCDSPGERDYDKPAPASMLLPRAINRVVIEVDKPWVSKQDGAVLGFIVTRAGFAY